MALPTIEEVTSMYLWGEPTKPTNIANELYIRDINATSNMYVDINEYMNIGAGRFANPTAFDVLNSLPRNSINLNKSIFV